MSCYHLRQSFLGLVRKLSLKLKLHWKNVATYPFPLFPLFHFHLLHAVTVATVQGNFFPVCTSHRSKFHCRRLNIFMTGFEVKPRYNTDAKKVLLFMFKKILTPPTWVVCSHVFLCATYFVLDGNVE